MAYHVPKIYISGERGRALKARAIAMEVFLAKARNTYCPRGVGDVDLACPRQTHSESSILELLANSSRRAHGSSRAGTGVQTSSKFWKIF